MGLEMVKFTSKHMVGSLHTIANQPENGTALEGEKKFTFPHMSSSKQLHNVVMLNLSGRQV